MCASARENSQGNSAKQVRTFFTLIALSTKNQYKGKSYATDKFLVVQFYNI